jgi:hypothetical protein
MREKNQQKMPIPENLHIFPSLGVPVKAKNWVLVRLPFSYSNYSHENNLCNCLASAQSEFTFHQNPIVSTGWWKLKIVSTKIC